MRLNPDKVGFGRHETFHLRFSWLSKGFQALQRDASIFEREEAVVELGVGKNMVRSIRYWLMATQMAELDGLELRPTPIGTELLGLRGWDPYLEDESTIWLLHWLLCSSTNQATVNYWFFNHFHKVVFTNAEAQTAFADFCREKVKVKFSVTTAKKDTLVLLRMYTQSRPSKWIPLEEALDSPMALLGLVSHLSSASSRTYQSRADRRDELPDFVAGFAVAQLFAARGLNSLPLEQLMYSREGWIAPGTVFRLTEAALLTKLERLVRMIPGTLEMREVAGLHQLYLLSPLDPVDLLRAHYSHARREEAA
jgi:Protein of unknown function (DUF4007)